MKNNNLFKMSLIVAFVILVCIGVLKVDYDKALEETDISTDEKVSLEIKEGENVDNILKNLIDNNLIKERYLYYTKLYLKLNNLGSKIQAGVYELPKGLSIKEIIEALQSGRNEDVWVLIPEGLRKDEIAEIVNTELLKTGISSFSKEEFLSLTEDSSFINTLGLIEGINDLEGFLFPDRYAFPKDINTQMVIERLVENFKKKVGNNYEYEDIILASIVEREGYNGTDRPIIAGIIIKRLEEGWLLQTDATLLYPVKNWKHTITIQDKEDNNPYNTYKKIGLPPTPICNPGIQSVESVWEPVSTSYYYYIHDNDGIAHYASTLEEHNKNVNTYLR